MPVTPECSFTEPTFAIHPAEMLGEPLRWTSRTFIPLSRISSWTGICCAPREEVKKKIKRQKAKGKRQKCRLPPTSLPEREPQTRSPREPKYFCHLPFAFCLLIFFFTAFLPLSSPLARRQAS